jgi:hypothetical protein
LLMPLLHTSGGLWYYENACLMHNLRLPWPMPLLRGLQQREQLSCPSCLWVHWLVCVFPHAETLLGRVTSYEHQRNSCATDCTYEYRHPHPFLKRDRPNAAAKNPSFPAAKFLSLCRSSSGIQKHHLGTKLVTTRSLSVCTSLLATVLTYDGRSNHLPPAPETDITYTDGLSHDDLRYLQSMGSTPAQEAIAMDYIQFQQVSITTSRPCILDRTRNSKYYSI